MHSIFIHFPKCRDCDVSLRTKITMTPCRVRTGEALPRAEKFGDLITADHKVLNEVCESRNNHRYAVVVQDLATQWIQFYPCGNKTLQETEKCLRKFLEPSQKPKVKNTDNSLEFAKSCEELSWNHRTSPPCYCYLRNDQNFSGEGKLLVNITQYQHVIRQDFINLERKFYQESFWDVH